VLSDYLERNYEAIGSIDGAVLYRRLAHAPRPAGS